MWNGQLIWVENRNGQTGNSSLLITISLLYCPIVQRQRFLFQLLLMGPEMGVRVVSNFTDVKLEAAGNEGENSHFVSLRD